MSDMGDEMMLWSWFHNRNSESFDQNMLIRVTNVNLMTMGVLVSSVLYFSFP